MTKGKKYDSQIEKMDSGWTARITRQVTSKKVTVTKEQNEFSTEAEAREWADQALAELMVMQASRNERHGKQRKEHEEGRQERSVLRAEKTKELKAGKLVIAADLEVDTDTKTDTDDSEGESDDWSEELKRIQDAND